MDLIQNTDPHTHTPRRRKRTKMQIFKEAYLPLIIVTVTFILMVVFIVGGISRIPGPQDSAANSNPTSPSDTNTDTGSTAPSTGPSLEFQAEADALMAQAAIMIQDYDYVGALALLDTFPGDMNLYPELKSVYQAYSEYLQTMVAWNGSQVANLSVHLLIADAQRAFNDDIYGRSYQNNFLTTTEFSAILQQLYDNGYMLVSLSDLYELQYDETSGREIYVAKTLLLPPGKTPVMLTETNANYYTYMTDSNNDGKPDAGADGFAYKLCYGDGGFYNELVRPDGGVSTGAFDLVPLLENFIAQHPDFSYRNARAIIAFSGYDGILGYRMFSSKLTPDQQQEEQAAAAAVVQALRDTGYEIACFSYGSFAKGTLNYADLSPEEIKADLQKWTENIVSVIGETDIMVYAKEVDIAGTESYIGNSKFNVMYNAGFRFFLGTGEASWDQVDNLYVRHNRIMVTGSYLKKYPNRFAALFDAATVLDPYRANFA